MTQPSGDGWDAVIIGGGPAGATTAAILAQQGRKVRLFEREPGPRFHVGESLVPMTYWTFERIGVLDKLKESAYPRKYSVQFVTADGQQTRPFYFQETNPHESAVTWQVWREDFDTMMLDNAAEKGCDVQLGAHVTDVLFDGDRAVGVKVKQGGRVSEVAAKVVVDASGQSGVIANRLKLKVPNPHLRQASIWSYFKGARRDAGIDAGATIILSTAGKHCWFWYIPLPDDVTSVGLVSALDYLTGPGKDPEAVFAEQLECCPNLKERLKDAKRVRSFHVTKDFSYVTKQSAGDGWVMVGDAFGFLDPVYSTGVLLALKSGEFAADAIDEGLANNDLSARQLGRWEHKHRKAIESFRKLVYAFYSYNFSFGKFIRAHPQFKGNLVDLLVGDVYKDGVDEIFDAMGEFVPYDGSPPGKTLNQESAHS